MLYTNAKVFTPAGFVPGGFRVEDGRFAEVFEGERLVGEDRRLLSVFDPENSITPDPDFVSPLSVKNFKAYLY